MALKQKQNIRRQYQQLTELLTMKTLTNQKQASFAQKFSEMQFQELYNPQLSTPIYFDTNPIIMRKQYHVSKHIFDQHFILPPIQIIKPLPHQGLGNPKYKVRRQGLKNLIEGLSKNMSSPFVIIAVVVIFFVFMKAKRMRLTKSKGRNLDGYARGNRTPKSHSKKAIGSSKKKPRYEGMVNVSYKGQWQDSDSQEQNNALQDQIFQNYR